MSNCFSWRGAQEVSKVANNIQECFQRAGIKIEPRREKGGDIVVFEVPTHDFKRVKNSWPICQALANCTGVTVLSRGFDIRKGIRFRVILEVIPGNPEVKIRVKAKRVNP